MKDIGLFGGSFNPVHIGHILVAGYISQSGLLDEVWFVLSPLNPFKSNDTQVIEDERQRLRMLEIAVRSYGIPNLKVCDIELSLPRPSFTIDTLKTLSKLHPDCSFKWIIGSDNLQTLGNWKEVDKILDDYGIIVYPRPGFPIPEMLPDHIKAVQAPLADVSSSMVRDIIKNGGNPAYLLVPEVNHFIKLNDLYKKHC